ncbi:MAG: hypothetical protein RIG77_08380 [Cyclobacteriaceae bacterium]
MKHLFLLAILTVLGFQSCNVGTTSTWQDDNIEPSLKNEIEMLDKKVLEAVTTNNSELLKSIMSDKLLEKSGDNINQLLEQAGNVFTTTDYKILNQFQVKNLTTGIGNTVLSGISGLNDYIIHYQALNEEMFISILIPKSAYEEFIITNIYGKYQDGWKLNILQFGQYKIDGQTAPELYSKANNKFDKGYLVDAANTMFLCSQVANPANKFWQYQKEDEMKALQETIMKSVNVEYSFPLTLEKVDSKPKFLTIYPKGIQEGYFPMVEYLTNIDLKDTAATKLENNQIHDLIGQIFNGIDKDKKYIFYKALSEMPDGKIPVPTYGFVKELK